jgi:uncharacterized protein (TIGR02679 family)
VVTTLLRDLVERGHKLRYHGDFDWPGITIANLLIGRYHCRPWHFRSTHYLRALSNLAPVVAEVPILSEPPVAAGRDAELTSEMAQAKRAVHEEVVLQELIGDLIS